jgi:glutathione S-transferase
LAGENFSAVDAFFAPVVFRAQTYQLPMTISANNYMETILALPAMRAWYEAALLETWREPAHEQEVLDSGTVLADLRKQ